ncbi:BrnT family toxin [Salinarimonas sp.]|uniref:BrnT family toxin n=1 Tax=Salinarimonas sp. TaxID=2766526 RepID=UPI0032D9664D
MRRSKDRLTSVRDARTLFAPAEFEWDDRKAAANSAKHGIPFEAAMEVFRDPRRTETPDDRRDYGEDRFVAVGAVDGVAISVVYTRRGDVCRIISARRASRRERVDYGDRSKESGSG